MNEAGQILMATVATDRLDRVIAAYRRDLDLAVIAEGKVEEALALFWQAPAMVGRRWCTMAAQVADATPIRLVEIDPVPGFQPLRHFGWAALEVAVADVDALHARLAQQPADWRIIGPPENRMFSSPVKPMQAVGPGGEAFYFTQILDQTGSHKPAARVPVDRVFIAILAAPDLATTQRVYLDRLGHQAGPDFTMRYRTINRSFGLDDMAEHRFSMTMQGGHPVVQVDQYPTQATPRPCPQGQLPPGVAIITLAGPQAGLLVGAAGELIEVVSPP